RVRPRRRGRAPARDGRRELPAGRRGVPVLMGLLFSLIAGLCLYGDYRLIRLGLRTRRADDWVGVVCGVLALTFVAVVAAYVAYWLAKCHGGLTDCYSS